LHLNLIMDSKKFIFDSWTAESELSKTCVDSLKDEEFTKLGSLLNMDNQDILDLNLSKKGAIRQLERAILDLQTLHGKGPIWEESFAKVPQLQTGAGGGDATGVTGSGGSGAGGHAAAMESVPLDAILGKSSSGETQVTDSSGQQRMDLNPEVYLRARPRDGMDNYLKIVDYIPVVGTATAEEIDLGEVTLKLKQSKIKLESVSPSQWIVANSRIMAKLIDIGVLYGQGIIDYISYTCKIGELACRYSWVSVLLYDNEYRERQCLHKFRWGSDSQHLATVCLRERNPVKNSVKNVTKISSTQKKYYNGTEICFQYNSGRCMYGQKCNFAHVCLTCCKPHPANEHNRVRTGISVDETPGTKKE
jgi:hypothetical protein